MSAEGKSSGDIFLLLESDPFGTGALFAHRARDLGLRPILLCTEPESRRFLREFESIKIFENTQETVLDIIGRLGRDRVCGVWSVRDRLSGLAARVSMMLGKQRIDPEIIDVCHDKFSTRQALAEAGLNDVPFMLAQSAEEAEEAASTLGGRVVVKPRMSTGSDGVRLCNSPEEVRRHFSALAERMSHVRRLGVLVEAFVEGQQFSVQFFDGQAIGVTRQEVGPPPTFITVALDFPWSDDALIRDRIVEHAEKAIKAVGHIRGPGCVDIRYDSQGPHVIEINPRLASEMIPENIRLATGLDVIDATIRFACGMPYDLTLTQNRASATRWLLRSAWPLADIVGEDQAAGLTGVVHVRLFPQWFRGGPANSYKDRLAFVIAEGDSTAQAGEIAEQALSKLQITPAKPVERWRLATSNAIAEARRRVTKLFKRDPSLESVEGSPLSHSIIRDEASFEALQSEWQDLFQRAKVRTPFLRYSWLSLCWKRQRNFLERSLFVVTVRKNDRLVLIAPFLLQPRGWSWRLSFLDSLTGQYNDVLVEDSVEAPDYVDHLWGILAGKNGIECFVSGRVREDSPLFKYLAKARGASKATSHQAPKIDLMKFKSWEDYRDSLPAEIRQSHRMKLQDLERRGAVEFRLSNVKTCEHDMTWFFAQKRRWDETKGTTSSWLRAPETEELLTAVARGGIDPGRTWLTVLSVGGETIAASLSFREGSNLYIWKSTYDPAWRNYSPARTLKLLTIERAFQEGIEKYEMMPLRQSLKDALATGATRTITREIYL